MSKKAFDDFDDFATDYRRIHNESVEFSGADSDYFSEQKIAEIHQNESNKNLTFLDLGCGDGNSAVYFEKYFPASRYFGLDISKESIDVARQRGLKNAEFSDYNGFDISFEDKTFDVVLIACVMHHIRFEHHERVLQEVNRVLKDNGRLYIFEHNPFNPVTRKIVKDCPFDKDAVLLTPQYTKKTLSKLKFADISNNFTIFFPRTKMFKKLLFLEKYLKWMPLGGQYYAKSVKKAGS